MRIAESFLLIFVLFVLSDGSSFAQKHDVRIYSVNNGLPQGQVHDIEQTRNGFIWLATFGGGLVRFDGKNFKIYTINDGLRGNAVEVVFQDSKERLWVSTEFGGVAQLRADSLIYPFKETKLHNFSVLGIEELEDGSIWFMTANGGAFILNDGELSRLTTSDGLLHDTVWDVIQQNGEIFLATHSGLSVYNGDSFKNYTTEDGLSGEKVFRVVKAQDNTIWMGTSDGLTIWNDTGFSEIKEINGIQLNYIYDLIEAQNGDIWIGTENKGVFRKEGDEYVHLNRNNGLSSNYIYSIFEGDNNNIWIGTNEDGVNLYRGEAFKFWGQESGLNSEEVLSLYSKEDGEIWLGTSSGLSSFNDNKFYSYKLPGVEEYEPREIWDIAELPNGNLLILMPDNTIYEFNGKEFSNFTESHGLEKWFTYDLFVDSRERLWIGTDEGLVSLINSKITKFNVDNSEISGNVVNQIFEASNGDIWVGTYQGLSKYNNGSFKNITTKDGLNHSEVFYITEDSNRDLWIGTGGGVSYIQTKEDSISFKVVNFGKENGMKLVSSQFLWFDEFGYLWQGTNGGLQRLNVSHYLQTGKMMIDHYALLENGLSGLGIETNHKAIIPVNDGTAWMGTMNGVIRVDPSELQVNDPPQVFITEFKRDSRPIEWSHQTGEVSFDMGIPQYSQVTLSYQSQTFSFEYIGLDYDTPQNVNYRFRLNGFEEEWMPVTKMTSATYTNLSPGEYTFQVQAKALGTGWSDQTASVSFIVDHPFWQSYWFYFLVIFSILAMGYSFLRIRLGVMERKKLKELVDEQTKDLQLALQEKEVLIKEIHHRVKNNLAVISGLLELQMGYSASEFAREVLQESQRRIRSISMIHEKLYQNERFSEIDFQKYVDELLDIISYSFSHFEKEITVEPDVDQINLGIDQAISCGLILNELVSNCYEHAFTEQDNGNIKVTFRKEGKQITFRIADDGGGLPEDIEVKKADSLGLSLIDTLVKQLQGDLDINTSEEGTTFKVTFEIKEVINHLPI